MTAAARDRRYSGRGLLWMATLSTCKGKKGGMERVCEWQRRKAKGGGE